LIPLTFQRFLFAPLPEILSRLLYTKDAEIKLFTGEDPDEASAAEHILTFLSSFLISSGFGILFMLLHTQVVIFFFHFKKKLPDSMGSFYFCIFWLFVNFCCDFYFFLHYYVYEK
jgi:hypothetical protein